MMKNRAAWLALLVLGIATALMVFFVLPRISQDGKPTPETATAPAEQKPAESNAADNAADPASAAMGKMERLAQEANNAVASLVALFSDSKTPTAEAFAGARAIAETAVSELSALEVPDGLDAGVTAALTTARDNAAKALSILKALPAEPDMAAPAVASIQNALKGVEAIAPSAGQPEQSAAPATDAAAETASNMPKFDVLRVEPDGSTVIAGSAAPGSKLDIIDGDQIIASVEVGPTGDFAAVLDVPLTPGDHALALRATDAAGETMVSEEVATVSVPDAGEGKLLAMITTPGEASELITMPETVNSADKLSRLAAGEQASAEPAAAGSTLSAEGTPAADANMPAAKPDIQVSAVEIEGDKIFIAGSTTVGGVIRAYADDTLIGDAAIDAGGHFVVEGRVVLSVGSHTIRADLIDPTGKVVLRASVPFNRPEGEQVSVVAQAGDAAGQGNAMVPLDVGAFDKQRDALSKAFAILQSLYADGKRPTMDALAAARSATEIALKSLTDFRPGNEASPTMTDDAAKTSAAAQQALSALQALPTDIDAVGAGLSKLAALIDAVLQAAPPQVAVAQAPAAVPAVDSSAAPSQTTEQQPKTIEQAPLTESSNSVIIRRGDTLWQISRRLYGQGVRYTTIYLANEDQIVNPDKIEPGQIFAVPSEALPNAEELHRKRMHGEPIE